MSRVAKTEVIGLYLAGVRSVVDVTSDMTTEQWRQAACGDWDAADTVRHLVAVADWYHSWLDRALEGATDPPFEPTEFDERNEQGVNARQTLDGPEGVVEFAERADAYLY